MASGRFSVLLKFLVVEISHCSELLGIARNCSECSELLGIARNCSELPGIGSELLGIARNCSELLVTLFWFGSEGGSCLSNDWGLAWLSASCGAKVKMQVACRRCGDLAVSTVSFSNVWCSFGVVGAFRMQSFTRTCKGHYWTITGILLP